MMECLNESKAQTEIDDEQKEADLAPGKKTTTALTINVDSLNQES